MKKCARSRFAYALTTCSTYNENEEKKKTGEIINIFFAMPLKMYAISVTNQHSEWRVYFNQTFKVAADVHLHLSLELLWVC